jgi:hypothetical protein
MLVVWRLGEATVGLRWVRPRPKRIRNRIENAATAIVFAYWPSARESWHPVPGRAGTTGRKRSRRVSSRCRFGQVLVGSPE